MNIAHRSFRLALTALAAAPALLLGACSEGTEPLAPDDESLLEANLSSSAANKGLAALVTNTGSDDVSVIDLVGRKELATIQVTGGDPSGVAITPDERLALVASSSSDLSVIDIAALTEVATVSAGGNEPAVAITPDGKLALVTGEFNRNVSVIDIGSRSEVATVDVGGGQRNVAISPDGNLALVTSRGDELSVIDITDLSEMATLDLGRGQADVAITPDGTEALVTNSRSDDVSVVDIATRSVLATVEVGTNPGAVAITPDGAEAVVANRGSDDNVSVIDIAARSEVATVDVGDAPQDVAITPDGTVALVTNFFSDNLSVIDISARTELATVDDLDRPRGVAIATLLNVKIDIKPDDHENAVNPEGRGLIAVAILTTQTAAGESVDFDASSVDLSTVRFGPDRASPVHDLDDSGDRELHLEDVDDDGDEDLVLHFDTEETGIESGDTEATLLGRTVDRDGIFGRDHLRTVSRQEAPEPPALRGTLTSLKFFLNHADCGPFRGGSTGSWNFFLNGESLGSAGTASPCQCNSDEQEVAFTDREALEAWNPSGDNTISVEAVGTTGSIDIGIGFIRAELETQVGSATVAVFDATGGDASNRNLCDGFVREEDQSVFSATIE